MAKRGKPNQKAAPAKPVPANPQQKWADWERKVERLQKKDFNELVSGWYSHIPAIATPGTAPQISLDGIEAVTSIFPRVKGDGEILEPATGARALVLHESLYLAHKAVHVTITCADAIQKGRHTWAVVDAYQASLFAIGSILAFVGISIERDQNNFILVDVWAKSSDANKKRQLNLSPPEVYQFVRFKQLDHYQKWALLKRILRTISIRCELVELLRAGLEVHGDLQHANHRNEVLYQSRAWLSLDLCKDIPTGPIVAVTSKDSMYDEIYSGSVPGTVYLGFALVELCCSFLQSLRNSKIIEGELNFLNRRSTARDSVCKFDWSPLYPAQ